MMHANVAAVLLAAGGGSRFTGPGHKLSARLPDDGTERAASVIERSIQHALTASIGPLLVVTGAVPDVVPAHLRDRVLLRHNPAWADGQATSVRAALRAAAELGCDAVVVGLADQPSVGPEAWRRVARTDGAIVVATYDGRRANPVKLDAEIWDLVPDEGDEGARALMRVRPDLVREVACTGSPADIDTEEDLRRWPNS
jgi:molybdenum cofactor cytidylyltransferase